MLDAHLEVIARVNPRLNAIVTLAADQAREQARAAEAARDARRCGSGRSPAFPVAIKDVTLTAGIRTTFGSPLYRDHVPDEDAEVVRRLKAAGAIVLAKTNTPEFAAGANTVNAVFGATRNPWNPALSPAGSSGGSAVAVATGMVPLAQGTDFGGSVRVPAAFCGIVGIRPTPGLTPNYPMPLAWDPGQVHGPLARSAEDAALMLDAMVGFSRLSPISVAPPWTSALAEVERCRRRARTAHRLCVRHRRHRRRRRDRCRLPAGRARLASRRAPRSRRSRSTCPTAAIPIRPGAAPGWSGQQFERLAQLEELGANLKGNVKAGHEGHRARSRRRRADAPRAVPCASAICSSATTCCSPRRRR